jgi:hypothetical protein
MKDMKEQTMSDLIKNNNEVIFRLCSKHFAGKVRAGIGIVVLACKGISEGERLYFEADKNLTAKEIVQVAKEHFFTDKAELIKELPKAYSKKLDAFIEDAILTGLQSVAGTR